MRIIGYTYEADMHCPDCTARAWAAGRLKSGLPGAKLDEHTLPMDMIDREGNTVRPIFITDELAAAEHCGDCRAKLID